MKCEEIHEFMQRELDDDLSVEEQQQLYAHLEGCAECNEYFQRLKFVSDQLHALPKVTPPHSIVDQILPQLNEIEQDTSVTSIEKHRTKRSIFTQKRYLIPGSIIAAGLLFAVMINSVQDPEYNMTAGDMQAVEERANIFYDNFGEEAFPEEPGVGITGFGMDTGSGEKDDHVGEGGTSGSPGLVSAPDRQGSENEENEEDSHELPGITTFIDGEVEHVSPEGTYTAIEGIGSEYIKINKDEHPHYLTRTDWEAPWYVEQIVWVEDDKLYFVLHHEEEDERQYWLIHVEERGGYEEQLDAPLELEEERE